MVIVVESCAAEFLIIRNYLGRSVFSCKRTNSWWIIYSLTFSIRSRTTEKRVKLDKIDIVVGGFSQRKFTFESLCAKKAPATLISTVIWQRCPLTHFSYHSVHNKYFRLKVIRTSAISDSHSPKPNVNFQPKFFFICRIALTLWNNVGFGIVIVRFRIKPFHKVCSQFSLFIFRPAFLKIYSEKALFINNMLWKSSFHLILFWYSDQAMHNSVS